MFAPAAEPLIGLDGADQNGWVDKKEQGEDISYKEFMSRVEPRIQKLISGRTNRKAVAAYANRRYMELKRTQDDPRLDPSDEAIEQLVADIFKKIPTWTIPGTDFSLGSETAAEKAIREENEGVDDIPLEPLPTSPQSAAEPEETGGHRQPPDLGGIDPASMKQILEELDRVGANHSAENIMRLYNLGQQSKK